MSFPGFNKTSIPGQVWPKKIMDTHKPQGWQCPLCKTVYSPDVKECDPCKQLEIDRLRSMMGFEGPDPAVSLQKHLKKMKRVAGEIVELTK